MFHLDSCPDYRRVSYRSKVVITATLDTCLFFFFTVWRAISERSRWISGNSEATMTSVSSGSGFVTYWLLVTATGHVLRNIRDQWKQTKLRSWGNPGTVSQKPQLFLWWELTVAPSQSVRPGPLQIPYNSHSLTCRVSACVFLHQIILQRFHGLNTLLSLSLTLSPIILSAASIVTGTSNGLLPLPQFWSKHASMTNFDCTVGQGVSSSVVGYCSHYKAQLSCVQDPCSRTGKFPSRSQCSYCHERRSSFCAALNVTSVDCDPNSLALQGDCPLSQGEGTF